MAHIYEVGTRAWQPDETEGWVASEVEQKLIKGENVKLVFRLSSGEVCEYSVRRLQSYRTMLTVYFMSCRRKLLRQHSMRFKMATMLPYHR